MNFEVRQYELGLQFRALLPETEADAFRLCRYYYYFVISAEGEPSADIRARDRRSATRVRADEPATRVRTVVRPTDAPASISSIILAV